MKSREEKREILEKNIDQALELLKKVQTQTFMLDADMLVDIEKFEAAKDELRTLRDSIEFLD